MSTHLRRRDWLKQSSLALAGLTFAGKLSASDNDTKIVSRHTGNPLDVPIKLTSNENPYGPSPFARKAMAEAVAISNRYPLDNTTVLCDHIGKHFGLSGDHVLLGAGSTQILALAATYAALEKGNLVTAEPTFQTCIRVAERKGVQIIKVPLSAAKKYELNPLLSKMNNSTRLVFLCNPNNPTGTVLPSADVKAFIEEASKKCMVLLDEAYTEYCDQPTLSGMVASNKNLLIAKTFSKIYGLAGARIGYALAHPDTIVKLERLLPWPNGDVSAVSIAGAIASLEDKDFVKSTVSLNREAGDYTMKELKSLGFECIPSSTNFLYHSLGSYTGNWMEEMKKKNVLALRLIEENGKWTRITIGTMPEMQAFIAAAKQIV
ncbi:MAG: histidinol-phosphate transaminase [Chitinophagaceae bacterium]